MKAYKLYVHMC